MAGYARGTKAWGLCQKCGLRFLLEELLFDGYYPNLRVCRDCWDDKHPQERLALVGDPVALYRPSVDTRLIVPPTLRLGAPILDSAGYPLLDNDGNTIYDDGVIGSPVLDSDGLPILDSSGNIVYDDAHGISFSWFGYESEAQLSAGYNLFRSSNAGQTWVLVAALPNQLDRGGSSDDEPALFAATVETTSYFDQPPQGPTYQYYVQGYDVVGVQVNSNILSVAYP